MANEFLLVRSDALPEIFRKVAEAKRLLLTHQVPSASAAAAQAGISRSAFYKYRDAVITDQTEPDRTVINVQVCLRDIPGALSGFVSAFSDTGANILTVNQNIPINGVAMVSVSAGTGDVNVPFCAFIERLRSLPYVVTLDYTSSR